MNVLFQKFHCVIIIVQFLLISPVLLEKHCYIDQFENGLTSVFNKKCDTRQIFQIKSYNESSVKPPDNTNGYYLAPTDTASCVTSSIAYNFNANSEISFSYYTRTESVKPSCFWVVKVDGTTTAISRLIDVNDNQEWRVESGVVTSAGEISMQIWCPSMHGAILAIDRIQIQESGTNECIELIQTTTVESPTSDSSSSETSTSDTIPTSITDPSSTSITETTIHETTTSDDSSSTSITSDGTTVSDITTSTDFTTDETTTSDSVSTTPDDTGSPTPETTTPENNEAINERIDTWRTISIVALVIAVISLVYSAISTIYFKNAIKNRIINDDFISYTDRSNSWDSYDESPLPRLKVHKAESVDGSVIIGITGSNKIN